MKSLPGHLGKERDSERRPLEENLGLVVAIGVAVYLLALGILYLSVRGLW